MKYKLQSLTLPIDPKHSTCRELFYRSDSGILDTEAGTLTLGMAQHCDFATYLNACSWQKWQKYTFAQDLTLNLEIDGDVKLTLVGYSLDGEFVRKTVVATQDFHTEERTEITFKYPETAEQILGFEMVALSTKVTIFGGGFSADIDKKGLNPVTLSIATTTYKKEDFITKNVALIKENILTQDDDLAKSLYVHIVDNGETLPEDIAGHPHIFLHAAKNTGGSGGFSRGMIESMQQKPEVTHILLMDDDVLVLPESVRRTYNLLRILRPEHRNDIIAGAMLYYENLWQQHEDIGIVTRDNNYASAKPEHDLRSIDNVVRNEQIMERPEGAYSAWWYSCIPVEIVRKYGLSLPIFIRGDDTEYGIRTKANYITMNGICIWHMGFAQKTNIALKYFGIRNSLIMSAASEVISEESALQLVRDTYRTEILRFNYAMADLALTAFEDFLQGPQHLAQINNAEKMKFYSAQNAQLVSAAELDGATNFDLTDSPLSIIERCYLKITANGQKFHSDKVHKSSAGYTVHNGNLLPKHIVACDRVIAITPEKTEGILLKKDTEKFRSLEKRYKKAMRLYKKSGQEIRQDYAKMRDEITSEKYWRDYLGI